MRKYLFFALILVLTVFPVTSRAKDLNYTDNYSQGPSRCIAIANNLRYQSRDLYTRNEVSTLQDFLQNIRYLRFGPTGFFGPLTLLAVKGFQSDNNISPTGYVGPLTRAKIKGINCGKLALKTPVQGVGAATPLLGAFGAGSISISSCQDITQPGTYVLSGDISSANGICLKIHDVQNVKIDCDGHTITANSGPAGDYHAVSVSNATNFSVNNCTMNAVADPNYANRLPSGYPLTIRNSSQGVFDKDTFGLFGIDIQNSNDIKITNSMSRSPINGRFLTNFLLQDSRIVIDGTVHKGLAASVFFYRGSHNSVIDSVIDGGWDGVDRIAIDANGAIKALPGADEAVVIEDESFDIISGNILKNQWDCGIENSGFMNNTRIADNTIINSGICGIGGWYNSSLQNNQIINNTIDGAPSMFDFYYTANLSGGVPRIYFQDNIFSNNTFVHPVGFSFTSLMGVPPITTFSYPARFDLTNGITLLGHENVIVGNNVFSNNNFTSTTTLIISPASLAVDGGGNVCANIYEGGFPLNCIRNHVNSSCMPPSSGDWIVAISCTFTGVARAPQSVIINEGQVLTLAPSSKLLIDLKHYKLLVKKTGGILVKEGATLRQVKTTDSAAANSKIYSTLTDHVSGAHILDNLAGGVAKLVEYLTPFSASYFN